MILKKIFLKNIRSYKEEEIDFFEGSTLLSGDIGSGKTSILLAIEFGLFGLQPGQKGSALLRNGEIIGEVKLTFEVDGKEIIVERSLKKSKTISQDSCAITIDQEKKELSVTELKNKILELLNYPKEFSKKQNFLYKFTVYTPQEEMKQIILQDPETRINTLRHVFGIDRYKKILENVSIVISKIREEKRIKEAITESLGQDKFLLISKQNDSENKKIDLEILNKELILKIDIRKIKEQEKQEVLIKIEEKEKLNQEIAKTKILLSTKNDAILINKKMIEQLNSQLKILEDLKYDESKIFFLEGKIKELKNKKEELNEKNLEIASNISAFSLKNQENEQVKSKLSKLEICPTCLQDVGPVYKSNVSNKMDSNTSENVKKIENLMIEKRKVLTEISNLDFEINSYEKEIQEMKITKIRLQDLQEKKNRLTEIENLNISLQKDLEMLNKHFDSLKTSVFNLVKYDNLFEEKKKQLEIALQEEKIAEIKFAELKREIEVFLIQIEELKERISKFERIKNEVEYLSELESWITKKFVPILSTIEKNVMVKLKQEFSLLFSKWFSMLVSDNFNVWLNDDFTPIIEQQDYEIDYAYLSGGERTAVALAYRLSLTQVINSLMSKIKTKDLVILDEPTDGFSEQQLDKMREVLDELDVKQLIIVSHEQKIEGFVERVIKFKKDLGESKRA